MRRLTIGIAALSILAACASPSSVAPPPSAPLLSSWVEMNAGGMAEARAITDAPQCPPLEIDGRQVAMTERAAPDQAFPVRSCAAAIPPAAKSVRLAGKVLPLPRRIDRVVIFGDTGCRMKGADIQFCNDPKAWPFADVARRAAAMHPDLVIHVGDYHYRETPCPAGVAGCAGSHSGDNWGVWNADFFTPAAPLLHAAPWVMARGNHETCGRGGKGWFRFLDAAPTVLDCPNVTAAYALHMNGLGLLVFDSANADDNKADPAAVRQYAASFGAAAAAFDQSFWMVTHRPLWGLAPVKGLKIPLNATEQAAIDPQIPGNLDMVVSGHVHTFSTFAFGPSRPAQLVAGVGGSLYDQLEIPAGSKISIDSMETTNAFSMTEYGYLVMDRTARGWAGTLRAADDDRVLARCDFAGRDIACRKVGP